MANIFIAWQNRADEATLTGGSWETSLPRANMKNRQVQKVAQTLDAALASTTFDIDLVTAKPIGVLALVVHNISTAGRVRVTAGDAAAAWQNIVVGSNDMTNGAWTRFSTYATANAAIAPDGTLTADKVYEDTLNGPHNIQQSLGTLSGQRFVEGWFQAAGRTKGRFRLASTGSGSVYADFDLTAKVITASTGTATLREYSDGWFKVVLSSTFTSGTLTADIQLLDNSGNNNYTGNGSSGLHVWGIRSSTGLGLLDDSGYAEAFPAGAVDQSLLEWEDDNFWLGTLSANARAGFQSPHIYKLPSAAIARYWKVEILDSTNADGYIRIGRLFMARGWTPSVNYAFGAGLGYKDPTVIDASLSGAEYFSKRPSYRTLTFDLDSISDSEAYNYALELQRLAGVSGEVLVMPDGGENPGEQPLKSFVGRLKQVGPAIKAKHATQSVKFEVKELL